MEEKTEKTNFAYIYYKAFLKVDEKVSFHSKLIKLLINFLYLVILTDLLAKLI